ncbi:MAG: hypothetical protein RLZZ265_799 [Verrucomicrobiota bacterium]
MQQPTQGLCTTRPGGGEVGALGLGLGQREGRGWRLIFIPLGLHPVAQGPVVKTQFLGGAGDVAAVALWQCGRPIA